MAKKARAKTSQPPEALPAEPLVVRPPSRLWWWLIETLGAVLLAAAMRTMFMHRHETVNVYDEGIVLTNAHLLLLGKVPFRDFYSNYPPGLFVLMAGLFKLFGPSVMVERLLALAIRFALSLGAGRIGGLVFGRPMSLLTAGLVATWLIGLPMTAFAWLLALALALWVASLGSGIANRSPFMQTLIGFLFGAVSWFRHDLFVYWSVALGAVGAAVWLVNRAVRQDVRVKPVLLRVISGATVALIIFWVPLFLFAGFSQTLKDLYFDQVRYVVPARQLPMPHDWKLQPLMSAIALTFCGPVLAVAALALSKVRPFQNLLVLLVVTALSGAVIPQMWVRPDEGHALYTVAPGLLLALALATRVHVSGALLMAGLLVYPVFSRLTPRPPKGSEVTAPLLTRERGLSDDWETDRQQVLEIIAGETFETDPLYVGLVDHRRVFLNEVDLYFLANRPNSTRYPQFDPNIVNREEVQREMIASLEKNAPKIVVLSTAGIAAREPNDSSKNGAALLNEYFRQHYTEVKVIGAYAVIRRK